MKFDEIVLDHMAGKLFSNCLKISIAESEKKIIDRLNYLADIVSDKKIIHLGCADHIEILDYKMKNNLWLHSRLTEKARVCVGVDIDQEAINRIQSKYHINNLICADILDDSVAVFQEDSWDYIILGEILEHIDDPVSFLKKIRLNFSENLKKIIISVPNAWAIGNIRNAYHNLEVINSDHRYYFTPFTLGKILTCAGYKVDNFTFAESMPIISCFKHGRYMFHDLIHKYKMKLNPGLRAHLIMEAIV